MKVSINGQELDAHSIKIEHVADPVVAHTEYIERGPMSVTANIKLTRYGRKHFMGILHHQARDAGYEIYNKRGRYKMRPLK